MLNDLKQLIKKYFCNRWNVPYNRYGIPNPLFDHLKEGQAITFIDIGAHNGYFSDSLSKYCVITRGILIEPLLDKHKLLLDKFKQPVYDVLNCLVADSNGYIDFEVNELSETSSILHIKSDIPEHENLNITVKETVKRESKTLDTLMAECRLDNIDVLKIDVQGAELLVLKGAEIALSKTNMIWIEVSFKPLYENSATFFDIYAFMEQHNFRFVGLTPVFYSPKGELIQSDALFIRNL